jgi:hypothetical protein
MTQGNPNLTNKQLWEMKEMIYRYNTDYMEYINQ